MSLGCLYACCIPGTGIKQVIVCHVIVCEWRLIGMAVTFFKINCRVSSAAGFWGVSADTRLGRNVLF